MERAVPETTRALLESVVDYAGLFPPAGLELAEALDRFSRYRGGPHRFMLSRLVLPAARLQELDEQGERLSKEPAWPVTLLLAADVQRSLEALSRALDDWSGQLAVEAFEVPPLESTGAIGDLARALPKGPEVYFELSWAEDPSEYLRAISGAGAAAKLRTGGVNVDAFPGPDQLGEFVAACYRARVPFKCTAGLHHAVRSTHPITYEAGSPRHTMHGFLNVLTLAGLLHAGQLDPARAVEVLEEASAEAFNLSEDEGLAWRGLRVGEAELRGARRGLFHSFGSCSFEEPVAELEALGVA